MNYLALIGTVTVINILGAISPGPDFIVTVRNSLKYSRKAGIYTGLGVALGLMVHVTYCATGIGLLISKSVVLFSIMKALGAGYLMYLGVSSILSKASKIELSDEVSPETLGQRKAFWTGFLTNVTNPKAMLFFLSLFTFVLNPMPPVWVIITCALIIVLTAVVWFSSVAVFLTNTSVRKVFLRFEKPVNILLGCILIFLSIKIILLFFE